MLPAGRLLAAAISAPLLRRPWLALLGVLGVALGAAVVVAIDIAAASAEQAHERAVRVAAGGATHRLTGGPAGVAEELYVALRRRAGVRRASPLVELTAALAADRAVRVTVLGIDALAAGDVRDVGAATSFGSGQLANLLTTPGTAFVTTALSRRLSAGSRERVELLVGGRTTTLAILGTLDDAAAAAGADIVVDIATAQEMGAPAGRLSRVDLVLGAPDSVLPLLAGTGATLVAVDGLIAQQQGLSQAFQTNLRMMGVLALLVGLLLVYNTMTFSVIQRREQFGILRALGVTRRELFVGILFEALLIGAVAAVLGGLLGYVLASVLLELVARTLNDLYFAVDARTLMATPALFAKGALLAIAGAVAAAVAPAREACLAPPASVMRRSVAEDRARRAAPLMALAGVLTGCVGMALLTWESAGLIGAYAALFSVVGGVVLMVPWLLLALLPRLATALRAVGAPLAAFAVDGLRASASRGAVAVAALSVALAATVGVGIMIESFRVSVEGWLRQTLRADLYVSEPGAGARAALPPALIEAVAALPGVAGLSRGRSARAEGRGGSASRPFDAEPVDIVALKLIPRSLGAFTLLDAAGGDPELAWRRFFDGAVFVSEPFARRRGVGVGGRLELLTEHGWRTFQVAAVYRDYGRERGVVLLDLDHYRRAWSDPGVSSLGVYVASGAERASLAAAVAELAAPYGVSVRRNAALLEASMAVFDRTFAITRVLRGVTVVVAFVGVLSALMALQLERARELALLRASGATRAQAAASVLVQTLAMGAVAALVAVPLGTVLGWVLVAVVNTRAFGWTVDFLWPPAIAAQAPVLALVAALLAGAWPALRAAFRPIAPALRHE